MKKGKKKGYVIFRKEKKRIKRRELNEKMIGLGLNKGLEFEYERKKRFSKFRSCKLSYEESRHKNIYCCKKQRD